MRKMRWAGHGDDWPDGQRPCTTCKKIKLFSEFGKHKRCKFGINPVCKSCNIKKSKQEYLDKPHAKNILHRAKQRAKRKNLEFNLDIQDIVIPIFCPVLGLRLKRNDHDRAPSIDRIDPELGYIKGNIKIISNRANILKGNIRHPEEAEAIADYIRREITDLGSTT